jgi:uncharacterized protein YbcI
VTQAPVQDTSPTEDSRSALAEISREIVRIYKEQQFGRGPTKVRSDFAGTDVLVCTLENTFTAVETSLQQMGEHGRLRDTRLLFQYAAAKEFIGVVERMTGRKVRAFISGIDTEADVACETFVLEPAPE